MSLHSLQMERHALCGLIRNPDVFADVSQFLTEHDFYNDVHRTMYCVIRDSLEKGEKIDIVMLGQRINNLGISFKDEINIFDYIESISFSHVSEKATTDSAKELLSLRIKREIIDTAEKIKKHVSHSQSKEINEVVSEVDAIYGEKFSTYDVGEAPANLFEDLREVVEERGNNPVDEFGFVTPYAEFNRLYGGLRPGNLYCIASRSGQGKSTFLNDICIKTAIKNNIKVIFLDTEMSKTEVQFRLASSMTGVSVWHLETGNWRKSVEMYEKVRNAFKEIQKVDYFHVHVGSRTIDEICSIVRRWHMKNVGRGKPCLIAYDYVKLTGEKVGANWAEHQAIGQKVDKLKRLAEELGSPILTAAQLNRSGENINKNSADITDDSSAISLSDRLQWFASFVAIFRRKTADEIALDTTESGTHKLIPLKTRFQGRDAPGHQDLMRRQFPDGSERFVYNYLNFQIENFAVLERGSLRDSIARQRAQFRAEDGGENDGELI